MTLTAPTINAYLGLSAQGGAYFTLDSSTKGLLDSATYVLAGSDGVPSALAATTLRISRGRTNALEDIATGVATIQFNNHTRLFDPFNTAGTYYGQLVPRKRIVVTVGSVTIFAGRVEDWAQDYDVDGDAVATVSVLDWLGTLAVAEFDEWTTTAGQTAGPRLTAVLNRSEVAFPGGSRDLDTGISTLQADLVTWGSNVLNYAQLVARSDLGYLYDSRDGVLTFRDRHSSLNAGASLTFTDDFVTHPTGVALHGVTTGSTSELLWTSVSVDREGGTAQTATSATAVEAFGAARLPLSGLLLDSDAQSLDMANYLVGIYGVAQPRVASITVKLHALTAVRQAQVLSLDIASLVRVVWTPRRTGAAVDRYCIIEGVEISYAPGEGEVTFHLSDANRSPAFILDDAVFGKLGTGVLTF